MKKGKFEINNGKPVTVGYGLFSGSTETIDLLSILIVFLVSVFAGHIEIYRPTINDIEL